MNQKKKHCINTLSEIIQEVDNPSLKTRVSNLNDLKTSFLNTDSKLERNKIAKDFVKRQKELQSFINDNPELVNSQMEQAIISAAVGGEYVDEEIKISSSGRRTVKRTKKHIVPNYAAALKFLENKDKENWSPNPQADPELEDVSEIEGDIYGED